MPGELPHARRLAQLDEAFRTLPERYLGAPEGFDATYHVRLGDVGRTWEVRCTTHGARVRKGCTRREPDVVIGTDAADVAGPARGRAVGHRRLLAAPALRPRRRRPGRSASRACSACPTGARRCVRVHDVRLPGRRVSTLTMGDGPDVVCIHGLGATKASFFDTAAALTRAGYRVHALDLPGFGGSSKPVAGPYSARWFADTVVEVMDALDVGRAHLVGNSMGGRVAIEVGLRAPERVAGLALLAPAVAFVKRDWHPIVRLLRPELGLLPHNLGRGRVARQFWSLFADPDQVDPERGRPRRRRVPAHLLERRARGWPS